MPGAQEGCESALQLILTTTFCGAGVPYDGLATLRDFVALDEPIALTHACQRETKGAEGARTGL